MMVVHAKPNTQPGGVQGALLSERYHSACTALPVKNPPMASAPKFNNKKITILADMYLYFFKFENGDNPLIYKT